MVTIIGYALMAGRAYQTTRDQNGTNWFPIPLEWSELAHVPGNPSLPQFTGSDGFEAVYFQRGTEIVIAYAGTNPNSVLDPDNAASLGLATGFGSDQLVQAAEYYLQVRAANPTANIALTGHSLGGGLAALVGVFFGVEAVAFDQAPFAKSATLNLLPPDVAANLKAKLLENGHSEAELTGLTNFLQLREANGGIPNSHLVSTIRVDGEITSIFPMGIYDPIGTPAMVLRHSPYDSSVDMHSHSLLTAFLQSMQTAAPQQALNDVTFKLTDLLGMMFDENLYEHLANDPNNANFLERLVQHETGIGTTLPADRMVTRFTNDLWKLAQDGGLTMSEGTTIFGNLNDASKTLIAFAMQKYYDETKMSAGYNEELFTDLATAGVGSGGIQFDRRDVAVTLSQAKGYSLYFQNYLQSGAFSDTDRQLLQSLLPKLRDWYVQAGANGMNVVDTQNRGAFMLGGAGADTLTGGNRNDLLVGNAEDDALNGGAGADAMLGGHGNDTYIVDNIGDVIRENASSGIDTVKSSVTFTLGANVEHLLLTGTAALNGTGNELDNTITGNGGINRLNGKGGTDHLIGGDKNDVLIGGTEDDLLEGGEGFDTYYYNTGDGIDQIEDSDAKGRIISNGRLLVGGVHNADDPASTYRSRDGTFTYVLSGGHLIVNGVLTVNADFESGQFGIELFDGPDTPSYENGWETRQFSVETGPPFQVTTTMNLIVLGSDIHDDLGESWSTFWGNDQLYGYGGGDFIAAGLGHDRVYGGDGNDKLIGGIYFVTQWPDPFTENIDNLDGDDYLDGGNGNDSLTGLAGNDRLFGGDGNDSLRGDGDSLFPYYFVPPGGNDFLDGGAGDDLLHGDYGADVLSGGDGDDILQGDYTLHQRISGAGEPANTAIPVPFDRTRAQDDFLDGGAGNDGLYGDGGNDTLVGGVGNDQLFGDYNEILFVGDSWTDEELRNDFGNDVLDGGDGDDLVYGMGGNDVLAGGDGVDQLYGSDGSDEIYGGAGDDFLSGDFLDNAAPGDDLLYGEAGADFLIGAAGNDLLDGGDGDDALQGGQGQDVLFGGSGADLLFGQEGDDLLAGDEGIDSLSGGEGNDALFGDEGNDTILGDEGNDILFGGTGDDGLRGGVGDDVLDGGAGNDFYVFHRGDGHDVISDGTGSQALNELVFGPGISLASLTFVHNPIQQSLTIQLNDGSDSVKLLGVDPNNVAGTTPVKLLTFADGSQFALADQLPLARGFIEGDEGDETIRTGPDDDVIDAQAGNDTVFAGAGNDLLLGGSGIDSLFGEAGDDRLVGEIGSDQLFGQSGNDTIKGEAGYDYVEGGEGNDTIYGGTEDDFLFGDQNPNLAPPNSPTLGGDDFIDGEQGNDDLRGGIGNDTLLGGSGNDLLDGGEGDDILDGGTGDDLRLDGGGGSDVIHGGEGNDHLFAGVRAGGGGAGGDGDGIFVAPWSTTPGMDQLFGDDGDDYLNSGSENFNTDDSILDGGGGNDTFVVDSAADTVIEASGNGVDTIETFVSYTLPDNVENLTIAGVSGVVATGNALDNVMRGLGQGMLDGRAGNDTLIDAQSYLFGRGYGQDMIVDNDTSSAPYFPGGPQDTIHMAAGISPTDVTWERIGNDLIVNIDGTRDRLTIPSFYDVAFNQGDYRFSPNLYFPGTNINVSTLPYYVAPSQIERVQFSEGTVWGPGTFNATQLGSFYANIYTFGRGDGQDTIVDFDFTSEQPTDILQMNLGVSPSDVTAYRLGNALVLGITGTTDQLTIQSHFASVFVLPPFAAIGRTVKAYQMDQIQFVDGTVWDAAVIASRLSDLTGTEEADVLEGNTNNNAIFGLGGNDTLEGRSGNDLLDGGAGNDSLSGGEGNDQLDGGQSNDTLSGGQGDDTYLFNLGDGIDTIQDVSTLGEGNRIQFGAGITQADLIVTQDQAAQTLAIQVGSSGADKLVLSNFDLTGTDGSLVVETLGFADGSTVNLASLLGPVVITGTAGNDVLNGTTGSDTIIGGTGNDTLNGEGGNDTYVFNPGDGVDSITDISLPGEGNTLEFGTGITPDDLSLGIGSLLIRVGVSGDAIHLASFDHANVLGPRTIETFRFADGTALSYDQLVARGFDLTGTVGSDTITGTNVVDRISGLAGNDTIQAGNGGDLLDGGTGNDTMQGGPGNDTYVVDGLGDVVTEQTNEGIDTVESSVTYTLGSNVENLTLTGTTAINGTGNTLNNILIGNSANNTLNGGAGNDRLDGGLGRDTMIGGIGDDTYVVNQTGDVVRELLNQGIDTVESSITWKLGSNVENLTLTRMANISGYGSSANNVLMGNSGSNTLDGGSGNDRVDGGAGNDSLLGGSGNDTLLGGIGDDTLNAGSGNDVLDGGEGVDTLDGGSGDDQLLGGAGNDQLLGGSGADRFTGGIGNDLLTGGSGNDVYNFARGDGQDRISDSDSFLGNQDKALYGATINPLDVVLSRQANDLRLAIHGSSDQLTVQNWYVGTTNRIETIQAGNGQALLSTQVDQLIQAMASFSQQTGLTWDQAIDQRPQDVQNVLAASWQ